MKISNLKRSSRAEIERIKRKWNTPDSRPHVRVRGYKIVRKFKSLTDSLPVDGGLKCFSCNLPTQYIESTLGKVKVGTGSRTVDTILNSEVEVAALITFPILKTGRVCSGCKHKLVVVLPDPLFASGG